MPKITDFGQAGSLGLIQVQAEFLHDLKVSFCCSIDSATDFHRIGLVLSQDVERWPEVDLGFFIHAATDWQKCSGKASSQVSWLISSSPFRVATSSQMLLLWLSFYVVISLYDVCISHSS